MENAQSNMETWISGTYARVGENGPTHLCGAMPEDAQPTNTIFGPNFTNFTEDDSHGVIGNDALKFCHGCSCEDILYLQRSGQFLHIAHWWGYEQTVALGKWRIEKDKLVLNGISKILMIDVVPMPEDVYPYHEELVILDSGGTPFLSHELSEEAPSLLSYEGGYMFLGNFHVVILMDGDYPESVEGVDSWIQAFLENNKQGDGS